MALSAVAVGALGLAIAIGVLVSSLLRVTMDPREPLAIPPKIPLIGHIIGMLKEGPWYFKIVSQRCKLPIFTLPMLNGKSYVVVDPVLAVAVQRAASTLDFDEMVAQATPRLVKLNAHTTRVLQDPTAKEEGRKRMLTHAHSIINPPLAVHNLRNISQIQLDHFCGHINKSENGQEVSLYKFLTREIVAATMHSMYGPQNPFAVHPELLEKFWEWDDGNIGYAVSPFPQITARKSHRAMEECVQGWLEYAEKGLYGQAQPFLRQRYDMHMEAGISHYEHARLEMSIILGFNSNASVTTFWIMNNIFSRPDLLEEIREEVYANAFEAPATISATKLKDSCPLLNSVFRETLRLAAPMTSARIVLEDTIIADTYLLKKGNVVQISGGALNHDPAVWGSDVMTFNPRRFFYNTNGTKTNADGSINDSKANAVHPAAFRSFGGGASLCPGRHFALIEVISLAAMMVMGFELQPPNGMAQVAWDPPKDDKRFPLVVIKPTKEVRAKMVRRKGYENVKWELKI